MSCNAEIKTMDVWCDGKQPAKKISLTDAYNSPIHKNLIFKANDHTNRIF